MTTLQELGEHALIDRLAAMLPGDRRVVTGPGDDCAVVRGADDSKTDWLLTSDPLVEGIHFTHDTPPEAVGHKAVGRVLSDIAAMGGKPAWGLVNLVAPADTPVETVEAVYRGMTELASRHGFFLVGGDVAEGPVLELHAFGIGETPRDRAVLRSGARAGDLIFVTGCLGGSRAGRHLSFEPRIEHGLWLRDWASAMIDVSDGLAGDLRHITTMSRVGGDLNAAEIPISAAAHALHDGIPPLDHALHDGEDFELLFTVPEVKLERFTVAWPSRFPGLACTLIGVVTGQTELIRCMFTSNEFVAIEDGGYTHFR